MAADYLPHRQIDLRDWSANFSAKLNSSPGDFGVTPAQAAAYEVKHLAYASAITTIESPGTRTPVAIIAKNIAKRELEAAARELAQLIQNTPGMDNRKRSLLGLTLHREPSGHTSSADSATVAPRASHAAERPRLSARLIAGRQVRLCLSDRSSTRRGKPIDAAGAMIFSFVGERPPAEISEWKFEGLATRDKRDVWLPSSVPNGSTIWFTACWYTARGQAGAMCDPVYTNIAGGLAKAA
jgi:hypothetical protein